MIEVIQFTLRLMILMFGPGLTARVLVNLRRAYEELDDPLFKAHCDEAFNAQLSRVGGFRADRDALLQDDPSTAPKVKSGDDPAR